MFLACDWLGYRLVYQLVYPLVSWQVYPLVYPLVSWNTKPVKLKDEGPVGELPSPSSAHIFPQNFSFFLSEF